MNKDNLIKNLNKVEKIAAASKFERLVAHPINYINAILYRELFYKRYKKEKEVESETFFGTKMSLLLPSGTDIYLTGGKSHGSETRLARFLINNLEIGDTFIDVGAHYGYFSLLGSKLVGQKGKVFSFEAAPKTFKVLNKNTSKTPNLKSFNLAVSDEISELKFYEFPNLYSEYNSLEVNQYKNEKWFSKYKPKEIKISSVILGEFLHKENVFPKVIKIDVEGAEYRVINGLSDFLTQKSPIIVMEFLSQGRGSTGHQEATKKLKSLGYRSYVIDTLGNLKHIEGISEYLKEMDLESDNIVFVKST